LANFSKNPSMANESTNIMTTPRKTAPKKWKPKIGERYYVVLSDVSGWYYVHRWRFANDETCKHYLRTNNYFRTDKIATVAMNALENATNKLFKESDHG
jgi:hypothetical protein